MDESERDRVERLGAEYATDQDFDRHLIEYSFRVLEPDLRGPAMLELGAGEGLMTERLLPHAGTLVVVDACERFVQAARELDPRRVEAHHGLFEEYEPDVRFDTIVAARVLEHVDEPVALLRRMASWLEPDGRLCLVVPNAGSLHRRIGVAMGMLDRLDAMSERDHRFGHRRVYDRALLRSHLDAAGLSVIREDGSFLKPLSNAQMEAFAPPLRDAFFAVGRELPEWCAELYACAAPGGGA